MSPPGLIAAVVIAVGVKVSAVAVPGVLFGSVSLPVAFGRGASSFGSEAGVCLPSFTSARGLITGGGLRAGAIFVSTVGGALLSVAFFWAWLIWIVCSVRIAETNIAMNRLSLRFIIFEFPPRPLCRPSSIKSVEKL